MRFWQKSLLLMTALALGGCASMLSDAANQMASAFLDNDDPKVVEQGAPSYLLLLDAAVLRSPDEPMVLVAAASLNSSYAGAFVKDPERQKLMTGKALSYALRALCQAHEELCDVKAMDHAAFKAALGKLDKDDVGLLFQLGTTWAGWIQARADDWNAVADLPRVQALMERVVALDESWQYGSAHLYLGGLQTLLPPALGGKQEEGRAHLERALELSGNRNLMAKVVLARQYARATLDRELHDRLLNEVLAADPHAPGLTLVNRLAQEEARQLLSSADDYF